MTFDLFFFVTFVGNVEIKQSCLSSKQILLKEVMRTSLNLFLFSAVVSLFLVFFYNYSLTRPWTRLIFLTRGANSDDTLLRGHASLRDGKEQAERTGETLEIEKTPKTSESEHVLELGMKLKDPSPNETDNGTTQSDEKDRKEERYQLQQRFATRNNLIILSPGRGGSTFLGSLFDRNPHVMYFFEPLYAVENKMFNVKLRLGDKEPEN